MFQAKKTTSGQDALTILNCHRLPGRLNSTETAVLLGFQEHDIPALMAVKLLVPLGKPAPNAPKYFAAIEVEQNSQDREWLSLATKAIAKHWLEKNNRQKKRGDSPCLDFGAAAVA